MDDAAARGEDAQAVALQLEEAPECGGGLEPAVDSVERVEKRIAAGTLGFGTSLVEEWLRRAPHGFADEPLARPEPAVDGRAPEAELRRDRAHIDAPAVQVAMK